MEAFLDRPAEANRPLFNERAYSPEVYKLNLAAQAAVERDVAIARSIQSPYDISADNYLDRYRELLADGLMASQAKLLLDLEQRDWQLFYPAKINSLKRQGLSEDQAKRESFAEVEERKAAALAKVRNGIFSKQDWQRVSMGQRLYDEYGRYIAPSKLMLEAPKIKALTADPKTSPRPKTAPIPEPRKTSTGATGPKKPKSAQTVSGVLIDDGSKTASAAGTGPRTRPLGAKAKAARPTGPINARSKKVPPTGATSRPNTTGVLIPNGPSNPATAPGAPTANINIPPPPPSLSASREQLWDRDALAEMDLAIALSHHAILAAVQSSSVFRAQKSPIATNYANYYYRKGAKASDTRLERSRQRLEKLRLESNDRLRQRLEQAGIASNEVENAINITDREFLRNLTEEIQRQRENLASGGRGAHVRQVVSNWWAKQGGGGGGYFSKARLKGTAKKMAVMGSVGFVGGAAILAVPVVGATIGIVGAGMAAATSRSVAKGLAAGVIAKGDREIAALNGVPLITHDEVIGTLKKKDGQKINTLRKYLTVGDMQRQAQYRRAAEFVNKPDMTLPITQAVKNEVKRNRRRVVGAIGSSALGMGLGIAFGELLSSIFIGHASYTSSGHSHINTPKRSSTPSSSAPKTTAPPRSPASGSPKGTTPPASRPSTPPKSNTPPSRGAEPGIISPMHQPIEVDHGQGIINEIQSYAAKRGEPLSGSQSYQLYQQLVARHGRNIIRLSGQGPSTYVIAPGDYGLTHPGVGKWMPGVEAQIDQYLANV